MKKTLLSLTALMMGMLQPVYADRGAKPLFEEPTIKVPDHVTLPAKVMHGRSRFAAVNTGLLENKIIRLNLFFDTDFIAIRDRYVDKGKNGKVWIGHIENENNSHVVLGLRNNAVSGVIRVSSEVYEVDFSSNSMHRISQVDPSKRPDHVHPLTVHDAFGEAANGDNTAAAAQTSTQASGEVVDLMVLYTTQARFNANGQAGIEAKIISAVESSNQAYIDSGVGLSLNLVHMDEINYVESGDMGQTLVDLRVNGNGIMDQVHALRDAYGADQVALISADANYCGIAYVMNSLSYSFSPWAFSVVHDDSQWFCLGGYTLAHELGHNHGNVHDRQNSSQAGLFEYSYGYRKCESGGFRTIMSYSCSGAGRIGHFSNPSISYNGDPTGIDHDIDPFNSADAARSMNNASTTIANWRDSVTTTIPADPSDLSGVAENFGEIALQWTDNADNESGFVVERGVSGVWNEIASLSVNASQFTDNGVTNDMSYSYRVKAWNSVGVSNPSNEITVVALSDNQPPTTPTNLTASVKRKNQVVLNWDTSLDNHSTVSYQLYRDGLVIAQLGSTSFNDKPGTGTFDYHVIAVDAAGNESLPSNSVSITVGGGSGGGGKGGGKGGKGGKKN